MTPWLCFLIDEVVSRNTHVQSIVSVSKSSFLFSDKVFQKITDVEDETWLLRASDAALDFFSSELAKNETFR